MDKMEFSLPTNYSISSGGRFKRDKNKCQDCRVKADGEKPAKVVRSSRSDGIYSSWDS